MPWSGDLDSAGYEGTAAVCLAHGRFIPCRKQGPHQNSSLPADIEKVRYFQQMSAREARPAPHAPLEYEEETSPWQDRYLFIHEEYGEAHLMCGGHVLGTMHRNGTPVAMVLRTCSASFDGWTPRMLFGEMEAHFTTVRHYQLKISGRTRNAAPGTSQEDAQ